MLYKVVIICITAVAGASPIRLEPQFEAENEEELREKKLPEWLSNTGYTQVEGTDLEVNEVKPDGVPEPEPTKGTPSPGEPPDAPPVKGPVAPDGTQLPTLDEYVAAGYKAEDYESFIERRMQAPTPSTGTPVTMPEPNTPVEPSDLGKSTEPTNALVIGESKNADGAIYLGHDAQGKEVWDLPEPTSEVPPSKDGEAPTQS